MKMVAWRINFHTLIVGQLKETHLLLVYLYISQRALFTILQAASPELMILDTTKKCFVEITAQSDQIIYVCRCVHDFMKIQH